MTFRMTHSQHLTLSSFTRLEKTAYNSSQYFTLFHISNRHRYQINIFTIHEKHNILLFSLPQRKLVRHTKQGEQDPTDSTSKFLTFSLLPKVSSATGSKNIEALPQQGSHDNLLVLGEQEAALGRETNLTHLSSIKASGTLEAPTCTVGIMAHHTPGFYNNMSPCPSTAQWFTFKRGPLNRQVLKPSTKYKTYLKLLSVA